MGRKSSIDKLEPTVRSHIERRLRENQLTLDELIADLHEHFPGKEKPSRSAIGTTSEVAAAAGQSLGLTWSSIDSAATPAFSNARTVRATFSTLP